jgi:mannobiose 2-epimerase
MTPGRLTTLFLALLCTRNALSAQDLQSLARIFRPKLESNLLSNVLPFWYPQTLDRTNGGYILNHDIAGRLKGPGTKMIVTQSRQVWLFSRLARAGYDKAKYLEAAEVGHRFLKEKMWDAKNGGFFWETDVTGERRLRPKKHLYGQAFGLYALSEYALASGRGDVLEFATQVFHLLEAKAHDSKHGGYNEWFNEDWSAAPADEQTYMGAPDFKLMNTHLHLLEAMTTFYRASKLPLARDRLLELISIQSSSVVRKDLGACTDKYRADWTPVLTDNYARVSYGHDIENIWLLMDACDAAGMPNAPLLDLYRALFDYSLKYGWDEVNGGFYGDGAFNQPASNRDKVWWAEAEGLVAALRMYRMTGEEKYRHVFEKTYGWIEGHQVDWKNGEWFDTITPDGTPRGDKAQPWKGGYHNGRAMIECLEILKSAK